jgi:small subunit ribosomal protein S17
VKADDMREKADIELHERLEDLRKELFQRQFRSGQDEVEERGMTGTVTSDAMQKTITVNVERRYRHPKYGKYVVASNHFKAHDENQEARPGDQVEIAETRPLSKTKRWRLLRIIERAPRHDEETS